MAEMEKCVENFRGRDLLEETGVDGRILKETRHGSVDWIQLTQDTVHLQFCEYGNNCFGSLDMRFVRYTCFMSPMSLF
jgi:hypothetical protein